MTASKSLAIILWCVAGETLEVEILRHCVGDVCQGDRSRMQIPTLYYFVIVDSYTMVD